MIAINPTVVRLPDNTIGVLVARLGLRGCVETGHSRLLRTVRLDELSYHFTLSPEPSDKPRRRIRKA